MIIKKTTEVTAPSIAYRWVRHYMDEVAKHKNEDIEGLGIKLGKNYFTSRKPGAVTAHGYAKELVKEQTKELGLKGNEAVLAFLQRHCRRQRKKRRKILGIRMIMSLDPGKTVEMVHAQVDIDRLLVAIAEDTFNTLSQKFYRGDRFGFLMAIHHDAMTNSNKWRLAHRDPGVAKPSRPHIHAHLFVLPQTEKQELRISFSDHSRPLRNGQFIDMSEQLRFTYQNRVHHHVQQLELNCPLEVTPQVGGYPPGGGAGHVRRLHGSRRAESFASCLSKVLQ